MAIWPIVEPARPIDELIAEALDDLPTVALRAHAHIAAGARPRWEIREGAHTPGSGGARHVLACHILADPMPTRPYWRRAGAR